MRYVADFDVAAAVVVVVVEASAVGALLRAAVAQFQGWRGSSEKETPADGGWLFPRQEAPSQLVTSYSVVVVVVVVVVVSTVQLEAGQGWATVAEEGHAL